MLTNNEVSVFLNGNFSGNGSGLTNIPLTGLQAVPLTNGQAGVSLNGQTTVSNLSVTATNLPNYLVVSNAPALNGSAIFNLNASQLSSGTVANCPAGNQRHRKRHNFSCRQPDLGDAVFIRDVRHGQHQPD